MQNYGNRQISVFELMQIIDTVLQISDFQLNMEQVDNNTILSTLQSQNTHYLEKILKQQKEIKDILSEIKTDIRQN